MQEVHESFTRMARIMNIAHGIKQNGVCQAGLLTLATAGILHVEALLLMRVACNITKYTENSMNHT